MMRPMRRNSDKPHRCPRCHAVRTWDLSGFKLFLSCPKCKVFWLYGRKV